MLPDAEDFVQELRTHIWESANKYATHDHLRIEQAFRIALDNMEDPEVLANRFYEESGYEYTSSQDPSTYSTPSHSSFSQSFQQKSVVPERKLDQDKFLLIAVLGFFAVMIIGGTLVATIHDPVISILGSLIQMAAFVIFIGYLYYRDDQTFQDQITRLREKFEKAHAEHLENKSAKGISNRERRSLKRELRKMRREGRQTTSLDAFFIHLGAFLGAVFMFAVILLLIYVSYIRVVPFFNDYWYSIGLVIFIIMIGSQMIYFAAKAFLGQVRGLRML